MPAGSRAALSIAKGLSALMGPTVEIAIHDLGTGRIEHIENPRSHRQAGEPSLIEDELREELDEDVIGPYEKVSPEGEKVRSVTTVIRDAEGQPSHLCCINVYYGQLDRAIGLLEQFFRGASAKARPESLFRRDWRERINDAIREYLSDTGREFRSLETRQKRELISKIRRDGLLEVRYSVPYLAATLDVSPATIYNHLKALE